MQCGCIEAGADQWLDGVCQPASGLHHQDLLQEIEDELIVGTAEHLFDAAIGPAVSNPKAFGKRVRVVVVLPAREVFASPDSQCIGSVNREELFVTAAAAGPPGFGLCDVGSSMVASYYLRQPRPPDPIVLHLSDESLLRIAWVVPELVPPHQHPHHGKGLH